MIDAQPLAWLLFRPIRLAEPRFGVAAMVQAPSRLAGCHVSADGMIDESEGSG